MKPTYKTLITILLFGAAWGGAEAVINASLDGISGPIPRSVILAGVALFILTVARTLLPIGGSTLAIGIIATAFKAVGLPSFWGCQLAAVVGQAMICEVTFSIAQRQGALGKLRVMIPVMIAASLANSMLFAFSQAYLFQNSWWLDRGLPGLLSWVLGTGSMAAIASTLGYIAGREVAGHVRASFERFAENHRLAYGLASVAVTLGTLAAIAMA